MLQSYATATRMWSLRCFPTLPDPCNPPSPLGAAHNLVFSTVCAVADAVQSSQPQLVHLLSCFHLLGWFCFFMASRTTHHDMASLVWRGGFFPKHCHLLPWFAHECCPGSRFSCKSACPSAFHLPSRPLTEYHSGLHCPSDLESTSVCIKLTGFCHQPCDAGCCIVGNQFGSCQSLQLARAPDLMSGLC